MAGRRAKFLDGPAILDLKRPRIPKWKFWPHGRKRMEAAALSQKKRLAGAKAVIPDRTAGVSPGHTRADDAALWAIAKWRAEEIVEKMIEDGDVFDREELDRVDVPGTDENIAKAVLTEAVKVALGPVDRKSKLTAMKMVLDFTKQKPAQKIDAKVNSLEDWLNDVNGDGAE